MFLVDNSGWGSSIMSVVMVVWLVLGLIIGFWTGFLDRTIKIVEMFLVVFLAVFLKNPVSALLYKNLPFFKLDIQVLNIIIYEAIAFILVIIVLAIILKLINLLLNVVEAFFTFLLNMGFPNKILGAVIGFIEGAFYLYIFIFIIFFLSTICKAPIEGSLANRYFESAPVFSVTIGPPLKSCIEIASVAGSTEDKDKVDKESLNILLKYKILSKENAKYLLDNNKLKINDADSIISKY